MPNSEQNQWNKIFCRMYGLAVMLSISRWTTTKNIAKINTAPGLPTTLYSKHTHTLLSEAFYSSTHFAPWNALLLNTVCSLEQPAPWNILLLGTLCSSTHSTLILSTICFLEHFAPWYSLLPEAHSFLEHFAPWNSLLQSLIQFF